MTKSIPVMSFAFAAYAATRNASRFRDQSEEFLESLAASPYTGEELALRNAQVLAPASVKINLVPFDNETGPCKGAGKG